MALERLETLLVANRGEIACRIMRTARALGLRSVAVYSDADAGAPHVRAADEAVRIGPGPAAQSYLDGDAILAAARQSGADAIHPGYGFLSERADFARAVAEAGLIFVGPPAEAIAAMGDKRAAKRLMEEAGVACVPGYAGDDQSDAAFAEAAAEIGYPVMIKAAAGGGGRGMRRVAVPGDLVPALERARAEALAAFGSDALMLERAIADARHVEVQIMADAHGNCLHFGTRDCSVQRRHQKLIEEAPAPAAGGALGEAMAAAALRAARAVAYRGAGTVEFLLESGGAGAEGSFWFLEMNTRLQVEHGVTEMVTGQDLVALQIAVARGAPLGLGQADLDLRGHAIEARLCAEDPARDFLPAQGRVAAWAPESGPGLRADAGIAAGGVIGPHYDSMLGKLIAWAPDRETARRRLIAALERSICLGVTTNAGFLVAALDTPAFAQGEATTGFVDAAFPEGWSGRGPGPEDWAIAAALLLQGEMNAAEAAAVVADTQLRGFASDGGFGRSVALQSGGEGVDLAVRAGRAAGRAGLWEVDGPGWRHQVEIEALDGARARLRIDGARAEVGFAPDAAGGLFLQRGALAWHVGVPARRAEAAGAEAAGAEAEGGDAGAVRAPMPGCVIALDIAAGVRVKKGARIAVLEAMKMQHQLVAHSAGIVREVAVAEGAQVDAGQVIAVIAAEDGGAQ